MERTLFQSFKKARVTHPTLPISGRWLQERAREIAKESGDFGFKASNTWLNGFKRRYRLSTKLSISEAAKVNSSDIDDRLRKNVGTLNKYSLENIFNADGTIVLQSDSKAICSFQGRGLSRWWQIEETFTVLSRANFSGTEKLTPWVIGHSANP